MSNLYFLGGEKYKEGELVGDVEYNTETTIQTKKK